MRALWTLVIICILFTQNTANAFFQKKDYKQGFLNNAQSAEKRHDDNSAFHSYEKAMYYYKNDKSVIEAYARFCERRNFLDKAIVLYKKLYVMTNDKKYQVKINVCLIKNGKLSDAQVQKTVTDKTLTDSQKKELNQVLIFHYSYKKNWKQVNSACKSLAAKDIGLDIVKSCMNASEKIGDKKNLLKFSVRNYELSPKDSSVINKIISIAQSQGDLKTAEAFVIKLMLLNPNDNGIKYKLAGIYERQKKWSKAADVYQNLMVSGDNSSHVLNSYAFVKAQLNPKAQPLPQAEKTVVESSSAPIVYAPKPLSGFKLAEKNFYQAWKEKDYKQAQAYLSQMLKEQPNNKKLLKHRVDIDVSQENYAKAIEDFAKVNTDSLKDNEFFAFLYSKTGDNKKALEIVQSQLEKAPNDRSLVDLALQYALADKNWDSAIIYSKKLLAYTPDSEKLLKTLGDLYSIKQDFANAVVYYEQLVRRYPKLEYKQELANLYMADKQFEAAEELLAPLYVKYPEDKKIIDAYLNSLLAQDKTKEAYNVIKQHNLDSTPEGYMVFGDLALQNKHYAMAADYYNKALYLNPNSLMLKNKVADSYRLMGYKNAAADMYNQIINEDPTNLEARLGLGSLEIDRKNFDSARKIFNSILHDKPDYRPARIAMAHSYIANDEKLSALSELDKLSDDNETKYMKAKVYYDMNMRSDSKDEIRGLNSLDAKDLKLKLKKDSAFTIIPEYTAFYQTLSNEFRLNYQKYGLRLSEDVGENANVFMEYNVYWYTSGASSYLSNATNEFKTGIQARPTDKWEYRADLGVKAFQNHGGMINTNSWIKYYFNDWFSLKTGFYRNNVEQSFTSAVGQYIDGMFTGQVADNKVYLEYDAKLPHQFYTFGRGAYGVLTAQNMPTNQYLEGYVGVGKAFYNNPKNPWINTFAFDVVSYNSAYQYNLLNLYSSTGQLFGGYFSPSYFNATTGNVKVEGYIKKLRLHYGVKAFGGVQNALTPDQETPTWGYNPYVAFDFNDHVTLNASYNHFTYADMERDIFLFNLVIKFFNKNSKG